MNLLNQIIYNELNFLISIPNPSTVNIIDNNDMLMDKYLILIIRLLVFIGVIIYFFIYFNWKKVKKI